MSKTPTDKIISALLRVFQVMAYAEGALLPSILLVAIIHWTTGYGSVLVAIVGATHGTVFTIYMILVPIIARILHWSGKTVSVAISVAFVPFATWTFERRVHGDIMSRIQQGQISQPSATSFETAAEVISS